MQDRKALQAGTSHFLGQNFSKAQEIKFLSTRRAARTFAWTTSWGVSTRLVGGLIMTHSDDDGLVLPPRLAPQHVVILPIFRTDEEQAGGARLLPHACSRNLRRKTYDGEPVRVVIDDRDLRGGEKTWQHIKRGVPLRLEIGPRDVAGDSVFVGRRDTQEKKSVPRSEFVATVDQRLVEIQTALFDRALALRDDEHA